MFVLRELFDFCGMILSPIVSPHMEIKDWDHFWFLLEKTLHLWKVPAWLVTDSEKGEQSFSIVF